MSKADELIKCDGKAQYKTTQAAHESIRLQQQRRGGAKRQNSSKGYSIKAYHCNFCNFYHIGKGMDK